MKKHLGSLFALGVVASLVACSGDVNDNKTNASAGASGTSGNAGHAGATVASNGGAGSGGGAGQSGVGGTAGGPGKGGAAGHAGSAGHSGGAGGNSTGGSAGTAGVGGSPEPVCGNGKVEGAEQCDDTNVSPGDGCDGNCMFESNALDQCPGVPIILSGPPNTPKTYSSTGSTAKLSVNYTGSCAYSSEESKDAVYQVTPDVGGLLTVDVAPEPGSSFDAVLYARSECNDPDSGLTCMDNVGGGAPERIQLVATAGQPYYLIVDGANGTEGKYTITVSLIPPDCGNSNVEPGEDCDDGNDTGGDGCSSSCKFEPAGPEDTCPGRPLELKPNGALFSTSQKGISSNLINDYSGTCGGASAPDAVYSFHSPVTGTATVRMNQADTDFDSVIFVRAGTCDGEEIACGDDPVVANGDTTTFEVEQDKDYYVFIDGIYGVAGNFAFDLVVTKPVCGDGQVGSGEVCDDGNATTGDGCDGNCQWEGECGKLTEAEDNGYASPQIIPAQCRSFIVNPATMPGNDVDFYQFTLPANATVIAETFSSSPGYCNSDTDTLIALWKAPVPATAPHSGLCEDATGYLVCNDSDDQNEPCSRLQYTVPPDGAGAYVLQVFTYFLNDPIGLYGVRVMVE